MTADHPHTSSSMIRLTCEQITDLLNDYINQEMDETLRASFERHLQNCADCTAFLKTYRQTMHVTQTLRYEDVPEEMLARMQQFLHAKLKQEPDAK
jgi:predicted anti-sigma-YlaC factor YlaD